MNVRPATASDLDLLAQLWFDGWQDAHAAILPEALARHRTRESFRERLAAGLREVRVVGEEGAPRGLCWVKHHELYQLYVAAQARGSGAAGSLLDDGEARLAADGTRVAWLSCAIGNDRAARFYEKRGWRRVGTMINRLDTPAGEYLLETWRYEKELQP